VATGGVLVILSGNSAEGTVVSPTTALGGLPLLRRVVLAAQRAGFEHILIGGAAEGVRPLVAGTAASFLADEPSLPLEAERIVVLPGNVVPQPAWLRQLRELTIEPKLLYSDGTSMAILATHDVPGVLGVAAGCHGLTELMSRLRGTFTIAGTGVDRSGRFVVDAPADVAAAERWLLRSLIKSNEGFMSRHVERRLSLAVTRRLCATGITPNAMTIFSIAIGLAGACFFVSPAPAWQLTGALLFLAHSILDGCDGELARLKFLESRGGALLDVVGDNLVHTAVFISMAVGWSLEAGTPWPLVAGAIAVASTLATAVIVHGRGMRASTEETAPSAFSRLADRLVHRDFIYGIVLLAALGRAWWFLALTALGAPLFLGVLFWMSRTRRHAGS